MNNITAVVAGLLLAFVGITETYAATINVPGDQPTIQAAISASVNGDVIQVAAGTHHEYNINPGGKAITIQGTLNSDGSLATTIDGQSIGIVFYIQSGETPDTVIKNLVITGGKTNGGGGAIATNSSPTITGCTITGNEAGGYGGGIWVYSGSPYINGCTISDNIAGGSGGGGAIGCIGSPIISNCTITDNTGGDGGGINCRQGSVVSVTDCTISGNTSSDYGGGVYCDGTSSVTLERGFVCSNSPTQIYAASGGVINNEKCYISSSCNEEIAELQEQVAQLQKVQGQQHYAILELQQVVAACCAAKTCAGDENNDGVVNIDDLLIVISVWGPCP